jgi:hypothetical protein
MPDERMSDFEGLIIQTSSEGSDQKMHFMNNTREKHEKSPNTKGHL